MSRSTGTGRRTRCRSGAACRDSSTVRGRRPGSPRAAPLAKVGRAREGGDRHPGHVLAGPADLPARRPALAEGPAGPGTADQLPGARPGPARWSTPGPRRSPRRPSGTTAASRSSASSSRRTRPSPTWSGCSGQDQFTETVPMLDDAGHMEPTDVDRDLDVDIAVRWGDGYDTRVQSYVNIIATPKGGTHVAGFERALTTSFRSALQSTRLLKAGEEVVKDDVLEGMTAVVTVRLAEPQFEGQTKEVLGTPAVSRLVSKAVERELTGVPRLDQGQRPRSGPSGAGEGGGGVPGPGRRPAAPGGPAAQDRAGVLVAADQAGGLPAPTTTAPSCSSWRATRRWVRPSWPGTRSSRRCCRSGARSSTCRRPRSATC